MNTKQVTFGTLELVETYGADEYNRSCIDHVLKRLRSNRLDHHEYKCVFAELDKYKLSEMVVHSESVGNLKLSC